MFFFLNFVNFEIIQITEGYRPISPFVSQYLNESLSPWRASQVSKWYFSKYHLLTCGNGFFFIIKGRHSRGKCQVEIRWAAKQLCPVKRRKAPTACRLGLSGINSKRLLFLPNLVFMALRCLKVQFCISYEKYALYLNNNYLIKSNIPLSLRSH